MSFMDALRSKSKRRKAKDEDTAGDAALFVSVSDAGWRAELTERGTSRWKSHELSAPESTIASPAEQLGGAIAKFTVEQPQTEVARVVLSIDDPDVHLVDHRFARLNNFEPRAIREFGAQQAGGRPILYSYTPFGASGAREVEKRVLAFLPEDRLESYLFALGKLATALVCVTPAAAATLRPEFHDGGIFATLRVHGYFSTLMVANGDTGIVAVRQIPFGALMLAKAYADEHGVSLTEASDALRLRSRLPSPDALKDGGTPEHQTATFAALGPVLRQMQDEIAGTMEYFRFQRLAGRPGSPTLTFTAAPIAGLQQWLADAFEMPVETAADVLPAIDPAATGALNLLEGARAGVLKLGNQPYEFVAGRFVPVKGAQSEKMPANKVLSHVPSAWIASLRVWAAAKPVTLDRALAKPLVYGAAFVVLGVTANLLLVTGPAGEHLRAQAASYATQAGSSVASASNGSEAGLPVGERPNLWADTLLGVGKALSPAMKLDRLELVSAGGKPGAGDPNLSITGILPDGGANLKLVAGFIERLSQDEAFSRRYAQLRFTGAGEAPGGTDSATAAQAQHETLFHVVGLNGGRK